MGFEFSSVLDNTLVNNDSYDILGASINCDSGIQTKYDNDLLLERVGRIIMTFKGERVNNPGFGSLLETFLFKRGDMLVQHVENELISEIEKYEPRVTVIKATVSYNKNEAYINIELIRKDTLEKLTYENTINI